jgi:hypothetical protein
VIAARVEEIADAGERVDRGGRDPAEVSSRIAEALGEIAAALEVELALGLERDLLVHSPQALLELGGVELSGGDGDHATVSTS